MSVTITKVKFWGTVGAVILLMLLYLVYALSDTINTEGDKALQELRVSHEQAYFIGQRDALIGDIRIRKLDDKTYIWIKSPWEDSTKPYRDTIRLIAEY